MSITVYTVYVMPRGNPKTYAGFRLDPALIAEVRRYTDNVTGAVEAGLALWLKRERRQEAPAAKPTPARRKKAA
jgi:hypothetical protein